MFLTIYVRTTDTVRGGIKRGQFADPNSMRRHLGAFADSHRRAFIAFERWQFGAVPVPWRIAFGPLRGALFRYYCE